MASGPRIHRSIGSSALIAPTTHRGLRPSTATPGFVRGVRASTSRRCRLRRAPMSSHDGQVVIQGNETDKRLMPIRACARPRGPTRSSVTVGSRGWPEAGATFQASCGYAGLAVIDSRSVSRVQSRRSVWAVIRPLKRTLRGSEHTGALSGRVGHVAPPAALGPHGSAQVTVAAQAAGARSVVRTRKASETPAATARPRCAGRGATGSWTTAATARRAHGRPTFCGRRDLGAAEQEGGSDRSDTGHDPRARTRPGRRSGRRNAGQGHRDHAGGRHDGVEARATRPR